MSETTNQTVVKLRTRPLKSGWKLPTIIRTPGHLIKRAKTGWACRLCPGPQVKPGLYDPNCLSLSLSHKALPRYAGCASVLSVVRSTLPCIDHGAISPPTVSTSGFPFGLHNVDASSPVDGMAHWVVSHILVQCLARPFPVGLSVLVRTPTTPAPRPPSTSSVMVQSVPTMCSALVHDLSRSTLRRFKEIYTGVPRSACAISFRRAL